MSTNKSHDDAHISNYELYHIYKDMYDAKHLGYYWFARDSQPWKRMNQIRDKIIYDDDCHTVQYQIYI